MTILRASILLPCQRLDDFPTHLASQQAGELLAAWTALWHPALIHATGRLPGWHPADAPPDPGTLEGELVLVPSISRQHLAGDWLDRVRETGPTNPAPVEAAAGRDETIAAALRAAAIVPDTIAPTLAADFLALGFAHLQVELLTRAMRYTSVLDDEQFSAAVVGAAKAAVGGDDQLARDELARAFDLLADARHHVYAVDFYVIDLTLLAQSTMGEALLEKLARGWPTSLLSSGILIEQMAAAHPATLAALRGAVDAGTACVVGGLQRGSSSGWESPETMLAELEKGQQTVREYVGRKCEVFGQYHSSFSPRMPEILSGTGFRAALHAAFDGGQLPQAEQCKTRWGERDGAWLEALSLVPLDAARPETWLRFAECVGDTIAHDHVAAVLLASWPGQPSDYHEDLRRAAQYNAVLGKLITLEEFFSTTRETDDWTTFTPREYPSQSLLEPVPNPISTRVHAYRGDVMRVHERLVHALRSVASFVERSTGSRSGASTVALNAWSFSSTQLVGMNPLDGVGNDATVSQAAHLPDVPGCGYAVLGSKSAGAEVAIADGRILRNERLELTVSESTGGIQSLRTHRDRSTRVSQRLVFHRDGPGREHHTAQDEAAPRLDTQMIAERVAITRSDSVLGEITSQGLLLDLGGQLLARFTQTVRVARGLPAAIVDVQLEPEVLPEGDLWTSYFASRLAWVDEGASFRRGVQWTAAETARERIESPEWVEISAGDGNIVCLGMGLPFHRQAGATWLDTLLCVAGEEGRRFQFALGLDCPYPVQTALALLTAAETELVTLPFELPQPRGWFLHVGTRNVIITHLELLEGQRSGVRCRILETEGRRIESTLSAFRPFLAARTTDFLGTDSQSLSVVDGAIRFDIGPYRWIQVEAEWE